MTDKQIIERLKTDLDFERSKRKTLQTELQAKEQECEELRGDLYFTNEQLKDFKSHYDKVVEECENLREKYLGLKEQKGSYIVQLNTVNEQLDQLKAEVKSKTEYIQEQRDIINQYSKEIEMYKKCQGKRASKREEELKAENNELKNRVAELSLFQLYKIQRDEAEKILTEIKRLCDEEKGWCNCSDNKPTETAQFAQQILQKISEVEDES